MKKRTINRSPLTIRTAIFASIGLSLLLHLLFMLMMMYGRDAVMPPPVPRHGPPPEFNYARVMVSFLSTFLFCFILFIINFMILKRDFKPIIRSTLMILCILFFAVALSIALSRFEIILFHDGKFPPGKFIRSNLTRDLLLSGIIAMSSLLLYMSYRKQQFALQNEMLIAENVRTRYEALKNQVDPHFLFNSLNTLNAIIKTDSQLAQDYIQRLSSVFRHTLQNKELITVEEEVKFTMAYCSLMQVRYGESLSFDFDIPERSMKMGILSLTLLTLAENAIKHNVVSNRKPLCVEFRGDGQNITVRNRLQSKMDHEPGEGIGLANLSERYRLKCDREVVVEKTEDYFIVTIPLIEL